MQSASLHGWFCFFSHNSQLCLAVASHSTTPNNYQNESQSYRECTATERNFCIRKKMVIYLQGSKPRHFSQKVLFQNKWRKNNRPHCWCIFEHNSKIITSTSNTAVVYSQTNEPSEHCWELTYHSVRLPSPDIAERSRAWFSTSWQRTAATQDSRQFHHASETASPHINKTPH